MNKKPVKYQGNELWIQTAYLGKSHEQERNEMPGELNCGYRQLIWVSPINKNPMKYQGNELWKQTAYLGKSDEQERNEKPGNEL